MSKTNYKDDIIGFYNQYLGVSSLDSSEAVAWTTKESQEKRFEILLEIGVDKNNDTLLDLGCGLGHLVDYMKNNDYDIKNYTGIDINPHYIFFANKRNIDCRFIDGEIFDINDKYDYIIGSGNFTIKMPLDEVLNSINKAYTLANKGIAFNFLTDEFNGIGENDNFNCYNPENFIKIINEIYPKTRLVLDYLGNEDFTIYIYK